MILQCEVVGTVEDVCVHPEEDAMVLVVNITPTMLRLTRGGMVRSSLLGTERWGPVGSTF